jgi:hypothetical protein
MSDKTFPNCCAYHKRVNLNGSWEMTKEEVLEYWATHTSQATDEDVRVAKQRQLTWKELEDLNKEQG